MENDADTRRYQRARRQLAQSELTSGRLTRRSRDQDASARIRLGKIAELLGWVDLEPVEIERLLSETAAQLTTDTDTARYESAAVAWLTQWLRSLEAVSPVAASQSRKDLSSRIFQLITLGDRFIGHGLANATDIVLLGAMLDVRARPDTHEVTAEAARTARWVLDEHFREPVSSVRP